MDTLCISPGIRVRSSKSQAPRSRETPILKIQTSAPKLFASRVTLEPGAWSFLGHWSLELGASHPVIGTWSFSSRLNCAAEQKSNRLRACAESGGSHAL